MRKNPNKVYVSKQKASMHRLHTEGLKSNSKKSKIPQLKDYISKRLRTEDNYQPLRTNSQLNLLKKTSKNQFRQFDNCKQNKLGKKQKELLSRICNHDKSSLSVTQKSKNKRIRHDDSQLLRINKNVECLDYSELVGKKKNGLRTQISHKEMSRKESENRMSKLLAGVQGYKVVKNPQKTESRAYSQQDFILLKLIGNGTFGDVYEAVNRSTNQKVAIKRVHNDRNYKNRQIQLMRTVDSLFVISQITDFVTEEEGADGFIKEYHNFVMPSYTCNFYQYMNLQSHVLERMEVKCLLYQMFRGILYLHSRGICHRDLKPQNILIRNKTLVICDLGSAKVLRRGQSSISYICSRCYRAPELILGHTEYTVSIDIWSAGCIVLELLNKRPLFVGKDSLQHLVEIIKVMGTPSRQQILSMNPQYNVNNFSITNVAKKPWKEIFPHVEPSMLDLLNRIMVYSPEHRLNAAQVLSHHYFNELRNEGICKQLCRTYNIAQFFEFDQKQIVYIGNNVSTVIPSWYHQVT